LQVSTKFQHISAVFEARVKYAVVQASWHDLLKKILPWAGNS